MSTAVYAAVAARSSWLAAFDPKAILIANKTTATIVTMSDDSFMLPSGRKVITVIGTRRKIQPTRPTIKRASVSVEEDMGEAWYSKAFTILAVPAPQELSVRS
jgi:hypothetical protein